MKANWETALAQALCARDPVAALRRAAKRLPAREARLLRGAQPDGVRLSALLVARLRMERLIRASPDAERWCDTDPEDFAAAFARYHSDVPPAAFFPPQEAGLFRRWCALEATALNARK